MNKKFNSPVGLNGLAVGPKIIRSMLPFLLLGIIAGYFFPAVTSIPLYNEHILKPAGWILLILGILAYAAAIVQFIMGFKKGKLITNGVYSLSRNPIYSSWIMFILPGLAMAADNWVFLSGDIVMYISLLVNIKSEEMELERIFGETYLRYQYEVNRVFFIPRFKKYPNSKC